MQLIKLLPGAGMLKNVLHLIIGPDAVVGDIILMVDRGSGVAFTGPTDGGSHQCRIVEVRECYYTIDSRNRR
jgi:delta 1-pyrroline-5-carboxylate dehydrogenase